MLNRMYYISKGSSCVPEATHGSFIIGVLLVLCSLAALVFAFWPVEGISVQATLAPTLLRRSVSYGNL